MSCFSTKGSCGRFEKHSLNPVLKRVMDYFFQMLLGISFRFLTTEKQKPRFAYSNLTLGICRSPRFLVLYSEIMDLSVNLWQRFSGQRSCKILYVVTPWSKEFQDFTVSYLQVHPYAWHSLLASLPLYVNVAVGIAWCWREHFKQCYHSEDGFQRELGKLYQVSFAEGCCSTFLVSSNPLSACY